MFFASCNYACPILVYDMKKIESKLSPEELKDYQFVLVTIDPDKDTPEALNEFAKKFNLDLNRWSLLTGDKDDILELAAVLGFKFKKEADGQFSHSNLINILNEKGEVVFQHVGLNKDISLAAEKLIALNSF
jgi:protein SCO1/2